MPGRAGEVRGLATTNIPENLPVRQAENVTFGDGGAMRAPLWAGPHPRDPNEDACLKLTFSGSWSWPIPAARRPTYSP